MSLRNHVGIFFFNVMPRQFLSYSVVILIKLYCALLKKKNVYLGKSPGGYVNSGNLGERKF